MMGVSVTWYTRVNKYLETNDTSLVYGWSKCWTKNFSLSFYSLFNFSFNLVSLQNFSFLMNFSPKSSTSFSSKSSTFLRQSNKVFFRQSNKVFFQSSYSLYLLCVMRPIQLCKMTIYRMEYAVFLISMTDFS